MVKNRKAIGILILIIGVVSFMVYQKVIQNKIKEQSAEEQTQTIQEMTENTEEFAGEATEDQAVSLNEKITFQFIKKKMSGKDGIYTNYLDTAQKGKVATGHEILSESAGLYLFYAIKREKKAEFYDLLEKTRVYLDNEALFSYRYTPKTKKKAVVNAAIDDLRLIHGLYKGAMTFGDTVLQEEASSYAARFVKTNIKGGQLADFYDSKTDTSANYITLCYIDLQTLKLLPLPDKDKEKLLSNQEQILKNGYLSNAFPMYKTRYDYQKKTYTASEEINVIESLLTVLHLSKEGLQNQETIDFLKEKVATGDLYSRYDQEGNVVDQNQSTAAYALCALIAAGIHDQQFYQNAMNQVEKFQITDTDSSLYGGFGDAVTAEAFSFDNLMALLAFASAGQ